MRTTNFSQILTDAIQLCGLDVNLITTDTFKQFRDFANIRLKMAWEWDAFPDLIRFEFISTTSVENDVNYVLKPANADIILNVWNQNPNATTRAVNIGFTLVSTDTQDRIVFQKGYTDGVWIEYRKKCPSLNGTVWNTTTQYNVGSQAYFDSGSNSGTLVSVDGKPYTANFYECLVLNTNSSPSTNPANWRVIDIPYIFGPYVARGILADYLRSESQFDSAQVAEAEAKFFLDTEIDKIVRQQSQMRQFNYIKTY